MMGAQETTVATLLINVNQGWLNENGGGGGGGGLKNATRRKGFPKVFEPIRGRVA